MSRSGIPNVTAFVFQHPSRCKACDSTSREPYGHRNVEECVTTLGDGLPVTHVVRQNTKCKDCGQARVDVTYHYSPDKKPDRNRERNLILASDFMQSIEQMKAEQNGVTHNTSCA